MPRVAARLPRFRRSWAVNWRSARYLLVTTASDVASDLALQLLQSLGGEEALDGGFGQQVPELGEGRPLAHAAEHAVHESGLIGDRPGERRLAPGRSQLRKGPPIGHARHPVMVDGPELAGSQPAHGLRGRHDAENLALPGHVHGAL
jgi:hypothetical protein